MPANSDTIGTRQKCHCKQAVLNCVTIAMHIYYKKCHLGLLKSVTVAIAYHYSRGHCRRAHLYYHQNFSSFLFWNGNVNVLYLNSKFILKLDPSG